MVNRQYDIEVAPEVTEGFAIPVRTGEAREMKDEINARPYEGICVLAENGCPGAREKEMFDKYCTKDGRGCTIDATGGIA